MNTFERIRTWFRNLWTVLEHLDAGPSEVVEGRVTALERRVQALEKTLRS
jgi:polyhydroxyalkanoate synthesis regulator phasin